MTNYNYIESPDLIRAAYVRRLQEEITPDERRVLLCEKLLKELKIDLGPLEKSSNLRAVRAGRKPYTRRNFSYENWDTQTYTRDVRNLVLVIELLRQLVSYYQENQEQLDYLASNIQFCAEILTLITGTTYADVEHFGFVFNPEKSSQLEEPISKVLT